jgi:pentatricopeptide repeat protein
MQPDIQLFNTVINGYNALSKLDPTAAAKANALLMRLELSILGDDPIAPDLLTFRGVCHAYAMSRAPDSVEKAEETLRRAQSLAAEGRISPPDTELYSSVLLAHTRSKEEDRLVKAKDLVDHMERLHKEGHTEAKPDTHTYNILLSGYANSRDPKKVEKAIVVFEKLNKAFDEGQRDCEPDANSYNWVRKPDDFHRLRVL